VEEGKGRTRIHVLESHQNLRTALALRQPAALKGNIRKRLVLGFPFAEIEESKIYIAAVMHQHRRPGYWKDRVRD
jgi:glutaredoxin-related protein